MSRITASIVLYNTPTSLLTRLLDCIAKSSVRVETYLVDNSPDPSDPSNYSFPDVTYLKAKKNEGYGAGHNIALRKIISSADFHFVLNPDINFEPTELEKMIRFMKSDPAIGLLMPRVVYPDGTLQYLCKLLPTPADLLIRRFSPFPIGRLTRRRRERFELRHTLYDKIMDVPYLSGCFMLFRISALRQIGLFDERFFMYPEDIDISRRMHAKFRTVFYPGATVVHDHAKDSYKSLRALQVHLHNMAKYFNKWGWFFDQERSQFNRATLDRLRHISPYDPVSDTERRERS